MCSRPLVTIVTADHNANADYAELPAQQLSHEAELKLWLLYSGLYAEVLCGEPNAVLEIRAPGVEQTRSLDNSAGHGPSSKGQCGSQVSIRLFRARRTSAIRLANSKVLLFIFGDHPPQVRIHPISDFPPVLVSPQKTKIDYHKRAADREHFHGCGDNGHSCRVARAVDRRFGPTKNHVIVLFGPISVAIEQRSAVYFKYTDRHSLA